MGGRRDASAANAKPPKQMKEPPMNNYRKKLGTSEKHRTHQESKERTLDVAKDQRVQGAQRGFVLGSLAAIVMALLLCLLVNWLLL